MRKKKCSAEVSIDTSCPPPTFEDYHRFTILDPQNNNKGYVVRQWFPASIMNIVVDKLGQIEDLMDKYEIKDVEELERVLIDYNEVCENFCKTVNDIYAYLSAKGLVEDFKKFKAKVLKKGELELI